MELLEKRPTGKGPAENFAGDVWFDGIHQGEEPSRARANMVRFAPGARSAWHSHGLGQTLYIVEGIALIQSRGGKILEAHPGDIVYTPPGEQHWHGAAPDHFMTHLALWENPGPGGGPENTWLEHVREAEYNGPRDSTRC
ncbi:cupin domain-containing protein [Streptomyces sp. JV176]|uniref:(R)-mandelonitrile lyase n=1 Tax=Streptomyces sp. JV176 TaxID=858630 RepID=UPI002E772886|nr:cupin domain-containing protein [Streptomyces sp. JV176]MEE1804046.1 cupin domain-containing protein [Streptomyces sp. JV176]